ncbi:MAG: TRAP transporter small permease [Spirochaetales bacterium]|nr:TRAP transporter small permease [Spirochaetales bacterium]
MPINPPIWTEELARWTYVWMVGLALGELERSDANLKVTILYDWFPKKMKIVLDWIFDVFWFGFSTFILFIAFKEVMRNLATSATILPMPRACFYAAFLVGFIFTLIRIGERMIRRLKGTDRIQLEKEN